ncbi:heme o synthase [Beijerinckia sp. L45]|uniref:heme o synthase n=1 Tax=Beijerinckia sp. L45 TaxID=1641855 RepID=UPI00131ADC20|nr:heme o synthase [Beijerinckia sp. L45]
MSLISDTSTAPIISVAGPGDYIALLKPRVMSLVVYTAIAGVLIAPSGLNPILAFAALLAITVGAGASGALNMWYDADIDAIMRRTSKRPIPIGRITESEALAFGLTLSALSVFTLGVVANWLAASLLAFTIFFYVVIYSMWLKRATPQNIVIGGAAGAFPPVVAYAAVTGSVSLSSLALFALIFIWTPPHFWALALVKSGEYAKAGIPMLPNVAGPDRTRRDILLYSVVLAPIGMLPWFMGFATIAYGLLSAGLGLAFLALAVQVYRVRTGEIADKVAMKLFSFSILYLFLLFAELIGERTLMLLNIVHLS